MTYMMVQLWLVINNVFIDLSLDGVTSLVYIEQANHKNACIHRNKHQV
jgi:hypothetical protein